MDSKQRARLRALANGVDPILQIGKDGIGRTLIRQADDALEARELIKGKVLANSLEYDARRAAEELSRATRSEIVQVIGSRFVLYRRSRAKLAGHVKPAGQKSAPQRQLPKPSSSSRLSKLSKKPSRKVIP